MPATYASWRSDSKGDQDSTLCRTSINTWRLLIISSPARRARGNAAQDRSPYSDRTFETGWSPGTDYVRAAVEGMAHDRPRLGVKVQRDERTSSRRRRERPQRGPERVVMARSLPGDDA
jgi:hypothetical protein